MFARRALVRAAFFAGVSAYTGISLASGQPVIATHPRILLTSSGVTALKAKVVAGDASWVALKAAADTYASYTIFPYVTATRTEEPDNTIFYDYEGSGWFAAAMPLALAFQMTGDTKYSSQLLALADEMIAAQTRAANQPPGGELPLDVDDYYPTRYLGPTLAIIYDWCYDELGSTRKSQMVSLMNAYFDDMRAHAYQNNSNADGNYFGGHLACAAYMGYASFGDNSRAQEMIDYARIRFDGSPSALVSADNTPENFFSQCFDGGIQSVVAAGYNGLPGILSAPFAGGFDFQGWAYGTGDYTRIIDYMLAVRSATGDDVITGNSSWFSQILRAEKSALFPDGFRIDPSGDWGGYYGPTIDPSLPVRLAAILAGSSDGPAAEHFYESEIDHAATYDDGFVFSLPEWEEFFFRDPSRPTAELPTPLSYSGFSQSAPLGSNGAIPYFLMRSDTTSSATWATATMGAQYYDDHQHKNAGHIEIVHGIDYLLVDASQWMGDAGSSGIIGGDTEEDNAAAANTLFFDDYGDFMYSGENQYYGGQGDWGIDQVTAEEQNDVDTFVRSDLSTAYDAGSDQSLQSGRRLDHFYRSFLYLRPAGIFIVFDQVGVKASTNPRGPYRKHLRWHFSNVATVSGNRVTVDQGASKLTMDTLLPPNASITPIDESDNPDDSDPDSFDDQLDSGTWRVEVSDPANPLTETFLTVFEPGDASRPQMTTSSVSTLDGKMTGAQVSNPGGEIDVVLFNSQAGQIPAAITLATYPFSSTSLSRHVLAGMAPSSGFTISQAGGNVTVTESVSGTVQSSPAGVLQFLLGTPAAPTLSGPTTACLGQPLTLTATAGATSYQWLLGGHLIGGATGATYSIASAAAGNAGTYTVIALDALGDTSPASNALALSLVACSAVPVSLSVDAAANGALSDGDGILEPGETAVVAPTWKNPGTSPLALTGGASLFSGPSGATYTIVSAAADYGTLLAGASSSCATATGSCFRLAVSHPAVRPAGHWDATFSEQPSSGDPPATWTVHIGDSFSDVSRSDPFYIDVEAVLHNSVTVGCGQGTGGRLLFCGSSTLPRGQMAAFMARVLAGGDSNVPMSGGGAHPYDCAGGPSNFTDVPAGSTFCPHVNFIYNRGITVGCAPGDFCPSENVTRGQLAAFVARALAGGDLAVPIAVATGARQYDCSSSNPSKWPFPDVPNTNVFCPQIGYIWSLGVVDGFGNGTFGPNLTVTRSQSAKFLVQGFHLTLGAP